MSGVDTHAHTQHGSGVAPGGGSDRRCCLFVISGVVLLN